MLMVHEKINENLPPLKKLKLSKKAQEKEDKIKRNIQMENQNWNGWKFQIHWNKLEWVNPRSCSEGRNHFCVSSKKLCLKDNNKTAHWVGHKKTKTLGYIRLKKIH